MTDRIDLTGDDVLQAGDEVGRVGVWDFIPKHWIGTLVGELTNWHRGYTFRRPLTTADITAAERVKFEAWCIKEFACTDFSRNKNGGYLNSKLQDYWLVWSAAVGCDPMGDV